MQESKAVEQESEQAPSNSCSSEMHVKNIQTSDMPDLTLTTEGQDDTPSGQPVCEMNTKPSESVSANTANTTNTAPPIPEVISQSGEPNPANPDRQSRVYTLPESYRGIGGDLCSGYGSLSRMSLHSYWPAKNFQTLPFLRDSYAPAGFSMDGDRMIERGENPLHMKTDHPAVSYPTLGGIHHFRPITTMELLREPSRTR